MFAQFDTFLLNFQNYFSITQVADWDSFYHSKRRPLTHTGFPQISLVCDNWAFNNKSWSPNNPITCTSKAWNYEEKKINNNKFTSSSEEVNSTVWYHFRFCRVTGIVGELQWGRVTGIVGELQWGTSEDKKWFFMAR